MTYQDQLEQTVSTTAEQVLAAVAMYEAGKLTAEALAGVVAAFIAAGNNIAAALADLSLAAELSRQLGIPIAPQGILRPASDPERLTRAARTLVSHETATHARWERLARAEGQRAAATAYSDGIQRSRHVTGWTRGISATACELCTWWHRDGRIWPADHPMPVHTGCTCNPVPTATDYVKPVRYH